MDDINLTEGQRGLYAQLDSFRQADAARDDLLHVSACSMEHQDTMLTHASV